MVRKSKPDPNHVARSSNLNRSRKSEEAAEPFFFPSSVYAQNKKVCS